MRLPSKIYSYKESVMSYFPMIIKIIEKEKEIQIYSLYEKSIKNFSDISDFILSVECLYAMNVIDYDFETGKIRYAL